MHNCFSHIVVGLHLHYMNIVFTTAAAFLDIHAALAAIVLCRITQFHRHLLVHAIMHRNGKTRSNGEINKKHYGGGQLFHLHNEGSQ